VPSKDEHLEQTRHNRRFFDSLDTDAYSDWAATALFYTALHYLDAFLATLGIHPLRHPDRTREVRARLELREIFDDYRFLKDYSENARYNPPTRYSQAQLQDMNVVHLARIRAAIARQIPL
jgi:hypothetical protein